MIYSRILSTGSFLPEKVMTNEQLAKQVDTCDDWIVSRTGIHTRHIADDAHLTSDLALFAAHAALKNAGLQPETIDLIIVATTTPDRVFPSTACLLQAKLGIVGCPAFDIQAVCAGFIVALTTADAYIRGGLAKTALVIGADTMSRLLDWQDRRSCILFGDGAGAVVLGASETPGILQTRLAADGQQAELLTTSARIAEGSISGHPYLYMDGPAVFKFAVKALSSIALETLQAAQLAKEQLDWLVPHQANIRIIESTAKYLGLSMERVVVTLGQHGNTSAASIPLALDCATRDGRIQRGHHVLLEGIGGGLIWGALILKY